MTRKIRISNAERRARSDRRANIAVVSFIVVASIVLTTFMFLSALHHGHKAGLSTADVIYGQ